MTKNLVAPSILAGDFANMALSVRSIEDWGADLIHCDVMDGVYVKNITFGMPMIKAIKKGARKPLDVHLMITEPERYVKAFAEAGANIITFHPEASKDPLSTLKEIRDAGVKCGIALNPNVPFSDYASLLEHSDMLLIMSVYAGLGGQKFIPETLDKVREAVNYMAEHDIDIPIEIDGGVSEKNAEEIRNAGVSILVAGSAVFRSSDPVSTIKAIRGE